MKKPRLLLIDDDREMCKELLAVLESHEYAVDTAYDGKTAISLLEKRKGYSLLLLDLKIPGLNGYEVLKYTKKIYPGIKALILSGSSLEPIASRVEEQVFPSALDYAKLVNQLGDGLISKPFDVKTLLSKIKELIGTTGGSGDA